MPGKPIVPLHVDLETRQMPGDRHTHNVVVAHVNEADPHPTYDAEVDADCNETATLEDASTRNEVLIGASQVGSVGVLVQPSHLVGRKSSGNVVALSPSEVNTILATVQGARAGAVLDLSGGAITSLVIFHTTVACTLLTVTLLYTEASSGDAGVVVTVGKESDAAYYYTGDSEVSKAEWYEKQVTLLATDIAAGDTVICGTAGGKVGTGNILVCIEYKVD